MDPNPQNKEISTWNHANINDYLLPYTYIQLKIFVKVKFYNIILKGMMDKENNHLANTRVVIISDNN